MKMMNQLWASCWTCLLLSMLLCEPVLCKGGRGGSRGSSRGTSSRSSNAGKYNGAGTRSRYRSTGRSSPFSCFPVHIGHLASTVDMRIVHPEEATHSDTDF
ncbi:unnamed protein product [Gadus morhua 'NCC']